MHDSAAPVASIEIDRNRRLLRVNGLPIKLGSRAFELLMAFAEQPGELLTKAELIDAAWGSDDVGDFNLHVQISALRKQLGKGAIVTVPGRGYVCALRLQGASSSMSVANTGRTAPMVQPLFGREHDLVAVDRLLREHALVVISGPGGVGKTSLARATLSRRRGHQADGTQVVDLTSVECAADLPTLLAAALRISLAAGDPVRALARALRGMDTLVLLDNAERFIDDIGTLLGALVEGCPALRVLVTSQVQLKLAQAHHYRLNPLPVPLAVPSFEESPRYAALALFEARVRAIDPHFCLCEDNLAAAAAVCRLADGLPLALEVVAARCASLGLPALLQHLDARMHWSGSNASAVPARQKTLSALMTWSHSLLSLPQQRLFRRLGIFTGGFTLRMIHGVLPDHHDDDEARVDLLADLVEHSLVSVEPAQEPRYRLLETARFYALDRIAAAGEIEHVRALHAQTLRDLFESAYLDCWQLREAQFVARYEPELENLRTALRWSSEHAPHLAIALAGASGRLWRWLSLHQEGLLWLERAATLIDAQTPNELAARLWEAIALQYGESASIEGRDAARRAADLYERLDDRRGQYLALAHLAYSYRYVDDGDEAKLALDALRQLEEPTWPPSVRLFGARIERYGASDEKRVATGRTVNETRLALATAAGSEYEVNSALVNLADLALTAGDADEAVLRNRSLLARLSHRHLASRAIALGNLIEALVVRGTLDEAHATVNEFVDVVTQLDFMFGMFAADALALLAALEQEWSFAAHLLGYSDLAYALRHRDRGPNERAIRERTWMLLSDRNPAHAVPMWMAQGAKLTAAEVCRLALQRSVDARSAQKP